MATVLCTGANRTLVMTRVLILEKAGHKVVPALSEQEVVEACQAQRFDVAVIGQAVPGPEKRRILHLVRLHCPHARILELYNAATGRVLPEAEDWLEVPATVPENLAEKVAELAARA